MLAIPPIPRLQCTEDTTFLTLGHHLVPTPSTHTRCCLQCKLIANRIYLVRGFYSLLNCKLPNGPPHQEFAHVVPVTDAQCSEQSLQLTLHTTSLHAKYNTNYVSLRYTSTTYNPLMSSASNLHHSSVCLIKFVINAF